MKIWKSPSEARGLNLTSKVFRILSTKGRLTAAQIGQRITSYNNREGTIKITKVLCGLKANGKVSLTKEKNPSGAIREYWTALTSFKDSTAPNVVSGKKPVNSVNLVQTGDKWVITLRSLIDRNKQLKRMLADREHKLAVCEKKFALLDKLLEA